MSEIGRYSYRDRCSGLSQSPCRTLEEFCSCTGTLGHNRPSIESDKIDRIRNQIQQFKRLITQTQPDSAQLSSLTASMTKRRDHILRWLFHTAQFQESIAKANQEVAESEIQHAVLIEAVRAELETQASPPVRAATDQAKVGRSRCWSRGMPISRKKMQTGQAIA